MSVLIEGVSVVVQRATLDACWPEGTEGFCEAVRTGGSRACGVYEDDALVSVACSSRGHADEVLATLRRGAGLLAIDDRRSHDVAIVDELTGPALPCAWLAWRREGGCFTRAWLAGREPGELAAPTKRLLKLSDDGGVETFLDFESGRIVASPPVSPERGGMLFDVVRRALDDRRVPYEVTGDCLLTTGVRTDKATYELYVHTDDARDIMGFYLVLMMHVPEDRRGAVAELCARANWHILHGNLDLDFERGYVRWRDAVRVPRMAPSVEMVDHLIGAGVWAMDSWHDALVKVTLGGAEAKEAFDEVEA